MTLRRPPRGVIVVLLWPLAACAVGPSYVAPDAPSTHEFRNAPAVRTFDPAIASGVADPWWEGFHDALLSDLVRRALTQNLDLAQAQARLAQARAGARAAGAALFPTGQVTAQGQWQRASLDSPLGQIESHAPNFHRDQSLYDLAAGAGWEADIFGGLRRQSQSARARAQAAQAARAGVVQAVEAETAQAYVLVRALQARLALAETRVEVQRRLTELAHLQYDHGLIARGNRDQADAAMAAVQADAPPLRAALESELNQLEVLVGVASGALHAELAAARPIPVPPGVEAGGGPASLVRRRPDILAAERELAAASADIGVAIAEYYPKVTLAGSAGFEAGSTGALVGATAFQPQGLVGLRWRLFDFGRIDAQVSAARSGRAQALAAFRQIALKAGAEVESALSAYAEQARRRDAAQRAEDALLRGTDAVRAARRAGQVSLIDALQADQQLLAARDLRLQAQADAALAAIACFRALGGGWAI